MIIAVDTACTDEYQDFIFHSLSGIAEKHPEHIFIFIEDKSAESKIPSYNNSVNINRGSLLSSFKIASVLKKHKAEILVTTSINSQTRIPQYIVAGNKLSGRPLRKAAVIITGSEFSKKEIVEKYKIPGSKIEVVYSAVDEEFEPIEFDRKEIIKEAYSEAHEFFLVYGSDPASLLNMLKAFSAFKKMQKSNMQLLIYPKKPIAEEFYEKLRSFKYKEEVKVLDKIDQKELISLTAAAYVSIVIHPEYKDVLGAMRAETPVITPDTPLMHEICMDAALFCNPFQPADVADKMMLLYKDEKLRSALIHKGKDRVLIFSMENTINDCWLSIQSRM